MYRQKKYECGNYMDVEVFSLPEKVKPFKRAKKVKETTPAQKNLNDKKSLRFYVRKANLNFSETGYSEELTYNENNLPQSEEEVHNDLKNYFERLRYWNRKSGLPNPEYMYVISEIDKDGNKTRYHIHMFIKNIDRDMAESLWKKGRVNTDKLQPDEYGITGKALYFARQGKGKKTWGCSKGLKQPTPEISDKFIQRKEFDRIERNTEDRQYFEKLYPGWTFNDCIIEEDEQNGKRIYIRMRKYEPIWYKQAKKMKPAPICDVTKGA